MWFLLSRGTDNSLLHAAKIHKMTTIVIQNDYFSNFSCRFLNPNNFYQFELQLKSSRNKKGLNDVTAARFSVSFSQLPAAKKNTKNGANVTSLRPCLFRNDFSSFVNTKRSKKQI